MTTTPRAAVTPQLIIGLCIMSVGVLLTLDVAGVLNARDLLRYWPVALIAVGAVTAAQAQDRARLMGGVLQMLIGTWLLLTMLHVLPSRSWRLFWPLLLIFAGGMVIAHTIRRRDEGPRGDPRETINLLSVLGGGNRTSTANPFRGGDLFSILGGGRLDLRRAVIPPGEHAVIDVFSMMGGYELLVPETWAIDDRTLPIMGGIGNETRTPVQSSPPTLVLRGVLFMGGLGIRN
jgi:predicted membrane protein